MMIVILKLVKIVTNWLTYLIKISEELGETCLVYLIKRCYAILYMFKTSDQHQFL